MPATRITYPGLLLDRDGVVNHEQGYIWEPSQLQVMPQALQLMRQAQELGYRVAIITNQGGIDKGLYASAAVGSLHGLITHALHRAGVAQPLVLYCPHHPHQGACLCRKPAHLMLERAVALLELDPARTWMVGDRSRDLLPAQRLGLKTALVQPQSEPEIVPHLHVPDMQALADAFWQHALGHPQP